MRGNGRYFLLLCERSLRFIPVLADGFGCLLLQARAAARGTVPGGPAPGGGRGGVPVRR
jgi:hypothetical protein